MTTQFVDKKEMAMELAEMIEKAGNVVYTNLLHVSQSGMTRRISCYIVPAVGEIRNIDYYMEKLDIAKRDKKGGLRVSGCGMDMGFHLVYNLSSVLYGLHCEDNKVIDDGYKIKQRWL